MLNDLFRDVGRARRLLTGVLVFYWAALFIVTHVPRIPDPLEVKVSDKLMHYAAYAGLGFLLGWRWGYPRRLSARSLLCAFAVVALYGIADELLQIPVGRTADILDWRADLIGCGSGLLLATGLQRLWSVEGSLTSNTP